MIYYFAVFGGTFIYLLLQLNGVYGLPDFAWSKFFKTNWIPTLLNLIIGCLFVAFKKDLTSIYPITTISALMLGIGGQALIKKLTNAFDSKINTVVGL